MSATPPPALWRPGRIVAERFDDSTAVLSPHEDNPTRVVIETDEPLPDDGIERGKFERTDPWVRTVDAITGLEVEVRRAPCGSGCRCSAEVRVPSQMKPPPNSYSFDVTVWGDGLTAEQAATVMAERLGFDEDYGFPYRIAYQEAAS